MSGPKKSHHPHKHLPPAAKDAVEQCHDYFSALHIPPGAPHAPPPRKLNAAEKQFETKVDKLVENRSDEGLYTPGRYNEELALTRNYADVFVDHWEGKLPKGANDTAQRDALKKKFHAILDGAAGMETGWSAQTVKGSHGAHTGVFQEDWDFMAGAAGVIRAHPAVMQALAPEDLKALRVATGPIPGNGLPATAFAGQGASFSAMMMQSYENFVKHGGSPDDFNGVILYQDHMLGLSGGSEFRAKLAQAPHSKSNPGVSEQAYDGNYLVVSNPTAKVNDLNPGRLMFSGATATDVNAMLHDKFVNAYNVMAANGASAERLADFEGAYLPQWKNDALKQNDIARVKEQHAMGDLLRASPEAHADACQVLAPMPPLKTPKLDGPAR